MQTTIHQVARAAGVSIATVSRALSGNGRVAVATRSRVVRAAQDLGYYPNDLARGLLTRATQTVAAIVPDITNPFFPELVKGIETVAAAEGHLVVLCDSADDETRVWADLAALRRKQVDGVILAGTRLGRERLAAVTAGLAVVFVDREADLAGASVVQSDHRAGARLAVEYLLGLGHRAIAHVSGPADLTVAAARRCGYVDALTAAGVPVDDGLVVSGGFLEEQGYVAGHRLVDRGIEFTAVFAASDLAAVGAMAALGERGLRVPEDVSVVGFDDIHLASYVRPRLTTVRQRIFQLGARAAEVLLAQLSNGGGARAVQETIPVDLVARESTAVPPWQGQPPVRKSWARG